MIIRVINIYKLRHHAYGTIKKKKYYIKIILEKKKNTKKILLLDAEIFRFRTRGGHIAVK